MNLNLTDQYYYMKPHQPPRVRTHEKHRNPHGPDCVCSQPPKPKEETTFPSIDVDFDAMNDVGCFIPVTCLNKKVVLIPDCWESACKTTTVPCVGPPVDSDGVNPILLNILLGVKPINSIPANQLFSLHSFLWEIGLEEHAVHTSVFLYGLKDDSGTLIGILEEVLGSMGMKQLNRFFEIPKGNSFRLKNERFVTVILLMLRKNMPFIMAQQDRRGYPTVLGKIIDMHGQNYIFGKVESCCVKRPPSGQRRVEFRNLLDSRLGDLLPGEGNLKIGIEGPVESIVVFKSIWFTRSEYFKTMIQNPGFPEYVSIKETSSLALLGNVCGVHHSSSQLHTMEFASLLKDLLYTGRLPYVSDFSHLLELFVHMNMTGGRVGETPSKSDDTKETGEEDTDDDMPELGDVPPLIEMIMKGRVFVEKEKDDVEDVEKEKDANGLRDTALFDVVKARLEDLDIWIITDGLAKHGHMMAELSEDVRDTLLGLWGKRARVLREIIPNLMEYSALKNSILAAADGIDSLAWVDIVESIRAKTFDDYIVTPE